jgi:hypothetical protein
MALAIFSQHQLAVLQLAELTHDSAPQQYAGQIVGTQS